MKPKHGDERQATNSALAKEPQTVFTSEQIKAMQRDAARYAEWKRQHGFWRNHPDGLDALLDTDIMRRAMLHVLD